MEEKDYSNKSTNESDRHCQEGEITREKFKNPDGIMVSTLSEVSVHLEFKD